MTLDDYLTDTGQTEAAFAARIGASQQTVNRLRRGLRSPSVAMQGRIHRASKGAVTPNDWLLTGEVA